MDDDMDVDLVMDEEEQGTQAQYADESAQAAQANTEAMNGIEADREEGEVDGSTIVPNKLHIRGLDNLKTTDIRTFVGQHVSLETLKRVEWIDDTSANLIFDNDNNASEALDALAAETMPDSMDLRKLKQLTTHPNAELQIRQAIAADVKLPGAKDRSRFYLMNPEYDPDMRVRKRRYGDDGGRSHKRRRDNDRYGDRDVPRPAFNVDFYDDIQPEAQPEEEMQNKRAQMEDLFKNRKPTTIQRRSHSRDGRLRDRSASPARDGDGMYGFEETQPYRRTARHRSATPPHLKRDRRREDSIADVNRAKELFPDKNGVHRRSDAQNLHPDEVADIIGKYQMDGCCKYLAHDLVGDEKRANADGKRDLFSRISGGPKRNHGRLNGAADTDQSSNINNREGFSILGAAKERVENPLVKELFPLKANSKKELFDGRIKGRATQRRRAEDLF